MEKDDDDDDDDRDNDEGVVSNKTSSRSESTGVETPSRQAGGDGLQSRVTRTVQETPPLLRSVLSKADSMNDTPNAAYFRGKLCGTIDVWWLFDDGGQSLPALSVSVSLVACLWFLLLLLFLFLFCCCCCSNY